MKVILSFILFALSTGVAYAQSLLPNAVPGVEFAVGGLYGYERNFGVRMVGLSQEVRVHANSYFDFTAGLTAVQAIQVGGSFGGQEDFTNYASLLTEVGLQVSPFSPNGRFQLGLGGVYQYGMSTYLSGLGYNYDEQGLTNIDESYDREIINRVGYVVSGSYRLWQTDHFTGRAGLKIYTYDHDFFAMIMSLGVQVGYRF